MIGKEKASLTRYLLYLVAIYSNKKAHYESEARGTYEIIRVVSEEFIKSIELNKIASYPSSATFQLILRSDVTEDKLSLSWVVNVKLFLCFFTSCFV